MCEARSKKTQKTLGAKSKGWREGREREGRKKMRGNETQPERAKLSKNWVEESKRGRRDNVRR